MDLPFGLVRFPLVLLAAVLVLAPPAHASVDLRFQDGRVAQPFQAWAAKSLLPLGRGEASIVIGPCPDGEGSSCILGAVIYMAPEDGRQVLAHELGHRFDYLYMSDAARGAFERIVGTFRPWRSAGGNSPHEQFAEAFSLCATYRHPPTFTGVDTGNQDRIDGGYGYMPTPRTHARACAMIRRQAARAIADR